MKNGLRLLGRLFRKDTRHLWPQILVFLALLITSCSLSPFDDSEGTTLLNFLTGVACAVAAIAAIHEERPVGDRQYWLTRPLPWPALLAGKAAFLLLYLNLPVLVCQSIVLAVHGFSPVQNWPVLMARQFFLTAFLILPAAALGAIARDLGRTVLAAIGVAIGLAILVVLAWFLWLPGNPDWGGLAWIGTTAVAAVALAGASTVVVLQYARRRIAFAWAMLAATLAGIAILETMPPLAAAFALQERLSRQRADPSAIRIEFDPAPRHAQVGPKRDGYVSDMVTSYPPGMAPPRIPIRINAVPDGMAVGAIWTRFDIEGAGVSWHSEWSANPQALLVDQGQSWLLPMIDPTVLLRIKVVPVRLHGTIDLTLLARTDALSAAHCVQAQFEVRCLAVSPQIALTSQPGDLLYGLPNGNTRASAGAPYSTAASFQILSHATRFSLPGHTTFAERPVAFLQRDFDFPAIRLADYLPEKK